jgi:digalactosyldiacylglycerol synthase
MKTGRFCLPALILCLSLVLRISDASKRRRVWSKFSLSCLRGGNSSSSTTDNKHLQQQRNNNSTSSGKGRKADFLDRIALISQNLIKQERDASVLERAATRENNAHGITPNSDLSRPGRHIHIVTTAALPWFTGTAVNPLLRAAYLHRYTQRVNGINNGTLNNNATSSDNTSINKQQWVTLVVPWLELPEDQQQLYSRVFATTQEQEDYTREWLRDHADMADAACATTGLQLLFYPARYHAGLGSIFAMGDIMSLIDADKMDVCIMEEPEHVNWFRAPGDGWTKRFNYVVGIVHTNYKEYASAHYSGLWTAPAISIISSAMVRAYCHQVIKLSAVLQTYAPEKEQVSNVHGVRSEFLNEGMRRAERQEWYNESRSEDTEPQVYYIGKLLWAKGFDIMLELETYYRQCTGDYFAIDIYGSGPDQKDITRAFHGRSWTQTGRKIKRGGSSEPMQTLALSTGTAIETNGTNSADIMKAHTESGFDDDESSDQGFSEEDDSSVSLPQKMKENAKKRFTDLRKKVDEVEIPRSLYEFRKNPIPAKFPGRIDHAEVKRHKVFVNPSISEVLCTTTAEALAMGKFAIIPVHPSNTFFLKFPNCLAYRNKLEFVANLRWALTHEPEPLTTELAREFTWEAATERLISASSITWEEALAREKLGKTKTDERIAWFHNELGKGLSGDMLRKIFGAGPVAAQVKYTRELEDDDDDEEENDDEEDDDDGLSSKFRRSAFSEALRTTVGDISSFIQ